MTVSRVLILRCIYIAAGGAAGSLLRYFVQGWGQSLIKGTFPLGTLIVNVVGCFLIGAVQLLAFHAKISSEVRIGLTIGVLGGFTTFSAFGWDTFAMLNDGQMPRALLNVLLSVILGFIAVWAGYRLAERWYGV
jgi:fluoride exporter